MELRSLGSSLRDLCNLFLVGQCVDKVIRVEQCREAESYICRKARNISYLQHLIRGSVSAHMQLRERPFVGEGVRPLSNYLRLYIMIEWTLPASAIH